MFKKTHLETHKAKQIFGGTIDVIFDDSYFME